MKKNFMSIAASAAIVSAALLFTGCGDDDSSSSSSGVSGALSGVLDPMAGVAYNTSSGVTGTTNGTGHFSFNPGDRVTFTIGSLQITTANNLTQAGASVNPDATGDLVVNNATLLTNLQELRQVIAGSTGANNFVFTSAVVSSLSSNLANKTAAIVATASSLNSTQQTALSQALGIPVANLTNASSVANIDLSAAALNSTQAAFAANAASFNSARATDKAVWIGGSVYPITGAVNGTSITAGGTTYTMGGALTAGTAILMANGTQKTIQAVMYNLTAGLGVSAGSLPANMSIKIGVVGSASQNETVAFYTNGTFSANKSGTVYTGNYSVRADGLGVDMIPTTSGYENRTVTFEDDPTSTGVVAQYWTKFTTTLTAAITAVLNGVKQVVTGLA